MEEDLAVGNHRGEGGDNRLVKEIKIEGDYEVGNNCGMKR